MILTLCLYVALAVAMPAFWVCACLWQNANREVVQRPEAQVIHFPSDFRRYMDAERQQ